ncbi:recombinase family protein [Flavobacterium gilvum]|nr:recombinase family protein [Flavobacterium gilvum]KFC57827.1 hypothetical protein FEM08_33920 [Flavobacterium gilvum]
MGKVAIYARVSTVDKQDYNRQINDCKTAIGDKYTENNIEIFAEQISGYKPNEVRPQLTKMLDIIEKDNKYFDKIYVTEISRLGRDPKATRKLIDDLTDYKIPIFITSINRQTIDEDTGERDSIMNIIIQVLIEFSDSESKTFKKRSKSGLLDSVRNGIAGGSRNLPYGYTKNETKKLIVDDEEAVIINEIFNLYKQGNGFKSIATLLNHREIPTRTNKAFAGQVIKYKTQKLGESVKWTDVAIDCIIKNPIYYGKRRYKGEKLKDDEVYDGEITKSKEKGVRYKTIYLDAPAIIDEQLFNECNEIRTTKTHRNYLTTYTYLLKDLLYCGCCGRNYFAKFKPVEGGDKVYICSSRLIKGGNCGNIGINISLLESAIYNEFLLTDSLLKFLQENNIKEDLDVKLKSLKIDLDINQASFDKKENEKKRLLRVYLAETINENEYTVQKAEIDKSESELLSKIELIKSEIFQIQKTIERQNDNQATREMILQARDNRTELKTIFNQFITRVIINKLDAKTVLASVFIQIKGQEQKRPMNLFLNIRGLIGRPMKYQYVPVFQKSHLPAYENNILMTDASEVIFHNMHQIEFDMKTIEQENLILIENTYPIQPK